MTEPLFESDGLFASVLTGHATIGPATRASGLVVAAGGRSVALFFSAGSASPGTSPIIRPGFKRFGNLEAAEACFSR
jgi:hypothetical protein